MNFSKVFNSLLKNRFIGFLFIGVFNTALSLILYAILLWLHVNYMLASAITFIFGVLEGFILNSLLVFKTKPHFKLLLKFTGVYTISMTLNLLMMHIFVEWFVIDKFVAQVITCALLAVINFYLVKNFVYRKNFVDILKED